jgi:uncharacterized membrane protein
MTEQALPKPTAQSPRRRPSLYRTVLSLGIAAIVAAWLPFSILYINALSKHVATVNATSTVHTVSATAGHPTTALTPVTTRTS